MKQQTGTILIVDDDDMAREILRRRLSAQGYSVAEALRLGANDYVTKSIPFSVILARIQTQVTLRRLVARVEALAVQDPLTGLYNRRGFYQLAEKRRAAGQTLWRRSAGDHGRHGSFQEDQRHLRSQGR